MEQAETTTAPRSLKERQRQEREALILRTAEEVLMEKGYHETSIDEIASRVGIAKGTVYLHFPSKEDLVVAIFTRDTRQLLEKVDEIVSGEASPRDALERLLHCMYGRIFVKHMQLVYSIYRSGEQKHQWKEHGEKLRGLLDDLSTKISQVLERGKAGGEFDPEIPTPVMLSAFFGLLSPKSYERLMVEEKLEADELANYLGRIYFKGVLNR
jgi:TetR/AcrR family fatty acid metabolism transcriptional regulator